MHQTVLRSDEGLVGLVASEANPMNLSQAQDHPAFSFRPHDPPVDLTTPKQADWLRTTPMAEIARFCRTWRAPGSVGAPTPAGLQKKLVEVVTSDPRRYAAGATELVDLPAEYLRAVVIGLREAARR